MKKRFGLTVTRSPRLVKNSAAGEAGGCRVRLTLVPRTPRTAGRNRLSRRIPYVAPTHPMALPFGHAVRVVVSLEHALPPELVICNVDGPFPRGKVDDGLIKLDPSALPPLNEALGRPVFPRALMDDLLFVKSRSHQWTILGSLIAVGLPHAGLSIAALEETVAALIRIASGLSPIAENADLVPEAARHLLETHPESHQRLKCVRLLAVRYPGRARAREALERSLKDSDFEVGFAAAEALGLDLLAHVAGRLPALAPQAAGEALRRVRGRDLPGGAGFLVAYAGRTPSVYLKREILRIFRDFPDPAGDRLFLENLASGAQAVRIAAADGLAERGGREALGPLYAVASDPGTAGLLRERARAALGAVRRRLGEIETGLLSITGSAGAEGGLSQAEGQEPGPNP